MASAVAAAEPFVDIARSSGLDFVHFNGMTGGFYFPEMMGSGAALFDMDGDGDLDVYLCQGVSLVDEEAAAPLFPLPPGSPAGDRLFRNETRRDEQGRIVVRFTDVTAGSGISASGYGMGVATGDYDNDGLVDLYVTNLRENHLYRNRGQGRFEDVTAAAKAGDDRWSVSATFVDYDLDGWLDLYVGNYVDYDLAKPKECRQPSGPLDYCGPQAFSPLEDRLLRNTGQGTFEDVSAGSGILKAFGPALGVVAADFNGDARPDIYVANDGQPNQLWIGGKSGVFEDRALLAGVAVNSDGMPEASMGIAVADFDADGDEDLFLTHLHRETNTLYVNDGKGWFEDATRPFGLANASVELTGFGTAWFDHDNDGRLDLFAANGAVLTQEAQKLARDPFPLKQRNQLFVLADGRYRDASGDAGEVFELIEVSRGAACGDVDNDGDTDVLVTNNNGRPRLLLNQIGQARHWIGFKVLERPGGRDSFGARVRLILADGTRWGRVHTDGSYASAHDSRVLFGLGDRSGAVTAEITWPDGTTRRLTELAPDRYHLVTRSGSDGPG